MTTELNDLMSNNINNEDIMGKEEFVLMRRITDEGKEEEYVGGGYNVKSFFMRAGEPIIRTLNNRNNLDQSGGKVSTPFENLAVPAGLFYINQRVPKKQEKEKEEHYYNYKNHDVISDDIMDKLFGLVDANKKQKRKTRKHKLTSNKKKSRKQI